VDLHMHARIVGCGRAFVLQFGGCIKRGRFRETI
jgi:hypothetical protein